MAWRQHNLLKECDSWEQRAVGNEHGHHVHKICSDMWHNIFFSKIGTQPFNLFQVAITPPPDLPQEFLGRARVQQTCSSRQAIETRTVEILEHNHDSLLQAAAA